MGRKALSIISVVLFLISVVSVLAIGFYYNLFNHPDKTFIVMMIIIPLIQLAAIFIARFKR